MTDALIGAKEIIALMYILVWHAIMCCIGNKLCNLDVGTLRKRTMFTMKSYIEAS